MPSQARLGKSYVTSCPCAPDGFCNHGVPLLEMTHGRLCMFFRLLQYFALLFYQHGHVTEQLMKFLKIDKL